MRPIRAASSCNGGACESVRQASMAPSSLRRTPAVERPWSRIDGAAGDRGGCRICPCSDLRALRAAPAVDAGLPLGGVGADGGSARGADFRRTPGERQRKSALVDSSATPSIHPRTLCGDQALPAPMSGAGPTVQPPLTTPIRTTPVIRKGGPFGPSFRLSIFSFDRPRPFSFRCLEKKMGAESAGRPPGLPGGAPPGRGRPSPYICPW